MARRRLEPIVLNIDPIDFVVLSTQDTLKFWATLPKSEETKPHLKVLEDSVVALKALKARRDAGEDVESEKAVELEKNANATVALNRLGPNLFSQMLKGYFGNMI